MDSFRPMGRKLSRRNKWRRWPPDRGAGAAESQAAAARGAGSWPPGSIFWFGAHGLQTRIRASFDENRHCYRRSPRHLRRHLPAAQTNRQRNPQRRQRNPPVRGETNGAAGRRIAELERPKAKERQREGGRLGASITNAGFGPMEPKPSQRHTDKEVGAALGISAGTYKRLKRIDNATRSDDKEIRLFAEKQMAPLAAGSPSWNGRKPSSGNRKAATMAARLDILAWSPWAPSQNRSVVRRKQTLLSAQPSASPPAPTGGSNESTTQPAASWRRGRPGTPKQRPPTPGPILPTR